MKPPVISLLRSRNSTARIESSPLRALPNKILVGTSSPNRSTPFFCALSASLFPTQKKTEEPECEEATFLFEGTQLRARVRVAKFHSDTQSSNGPLGSDCCCRYHCTVIIVIRNPPVTTSPPKRQRRLQSVEEVCTAPHHTVSSAIIASGYAFCRCAWRGRPIETGWMVV